MIRKTGLIAVLVSTNAVAQDAGPPTDLAGTYYCRSTAAAGIRMDPNTKIWSATTFNVSEDAYTIKITDTGRSGISEGILKTPYHVYEATVKKFGSNENPLQCWDFPLTKESRNDIHVVDNYLRCRIMSTEYNFNMKAKKFQVMFEGGYMDDWRENTDTPYVSVGKCDKID